MLVLFAQSIFLLLLYNIDYHGTSEVHPRVVVFCCPIVRQQRFVSCAILYNLTRVISVAHKHDSDLQQCRCELGIVWTTLMLMWFCCKATTARLHRGVDDFLSDKWNNKKTRLDKHRRQVP
jgi:hypothetical protein